MLVHVREQLAGTAFSAQPDLRRVILGLEAQSCLSGIHARRLRQVDDRFHLIQTACLGQ